MAFIEKLRSKILDVTRNVGSNDRGSSNGLYGKKNAKRHNNLITDTDPVSIWETVSEIGDGAFGKVYKTKNKITGVYAAAKIVEKCTEDELDDYMIEIDILSSCKHQNIVEIYEAYYYDQKLWMLIEFCSGGAVDTLMFDLDKSLSEPQIQYVIRETLEALAFLHDNFVIHRDMKAGNILLTDQGKVKLADFGVSAKNTSQLQRRYSFIGTPYWMSPEIIACETDKEMSYDTRTDIWSLGITCIELAEKEPPHNELNPNRVMMRIRKADPPKLKDQRTKNGWSKLFHEFLALCLDKTAENRPSARELLKHPFIADFKGNEKCLANLLGEKNATVNIIEELDGDDSTNGKEHNGSEDTDSIETSNSSNATPALKKAELITKPSPDKTQQLVKPSLISPKETILNDPSKKQEAIRKPIAPPPPPSTSTIPNKDPQLNTSKPLSPKVSPTKSALLETEVTNKVMNSIFEEICDEVIKCDDKAPSVPDVILQVISEILSENHQAEAAAAATAVASVPESKSPPVIKTDPSVLSEAPPQKKSPIVNIIASNSPKSKAHEASSSKTDTPKSTSSISPINSSVKSLSLTNGNVPSSNSSSRHNSPVPKQPATNSKSNSLIMVDQKAANNAANSSSNNNSAPPTKPANEAEKQTHGMNRNRTRKTITKTFTIDGQTQTIKKTVNTEDEERQRQMVEERRRDLIEHRRNLNEDRRKLIEQTRKQDAEKESLEQDFKEQKDKLLREFEIKLAQIHQFRKAEIERCEEAQAIELKTTLKRIRSEQDKALKQQREHLKEEFKLFKRELESNSNHMLMSKEHRDAHKKQKERELLKREEEYHLSQQAEINEEEKRIIKLHRQQLIHLETTSLLEKQNLIRTREAAMWELERLQMEQRCNVIRKHVRDFFYLQRHLMISKQEKDLEHLRQLNTKLEEDLMRRQNEEKRLFLKSLRQEQRSRREMYRRSLYIIPSGGNNLNHQQSTDKMSAEEEKRKLKEFEEREKEKFDNDLQRLTIRHMKQLEEYRIKADNIMKDLNDEQRLKQKQLVDAETKCLKDVNERYNQEYAYWQNKLRSRKQKLEEDFKREDAERSQFYQNNLMLNNNHQNPQHLPQRSPQTSSSSSQFSSNQKIPHSQSLYSQSSIQQNAHQFYSNSHLSPTSTLTSISTQQKVSNNNLTYSSSESNFTFGTQSLSSNALNQSHQSYIEKNNF